MMFQEEDEMKADLQDMFEKFFKEKTPSENHILIATDEKYYHMARSVLIGLQKMKFDPK